MRAHEPVRSNASLLNFCSPPCLCHLSYIGFHLLSHQPICHFHLEFWLFRLCLLSFRLFDRSSWLVIVISISICFPPFLISFLDPSSKYLSPPSTHLIAFFEPIGATFYPSFQPKNTLHRRHSIYSIYTRLAA